jgi:hypothetical protein
MHDIVETTGKVSVDKTLRHVTFVEVRPGDVYPDGGWVPLVHQKSGVVVMAAQKDAQKDIPPLAPPTKPSPIKPSIASATPTSVQPPSNPNNPNLAPGILGKRLCAVLCSGRTHVSVADLVALLAHPPLWLREELERGLGER